jgi:hypothetical protein
MRSYTTGGMDVALDNSARGQELRQTTLKMKAQRKHRLQLIFIVTTPRTNAQRKLSHRYLLFILIAVTTIRALLYSDEESFQNLPSDSKIIMTLAHLRGANVRKESAITEEKPSDLETMMLAHLGSGNEMKEVVTPEEETASVSNVSWNDTSPAMIATTANFW